MSIRERHMFGGFTCDRCGSVFEVTWIERWVAESDAARDAAAAGWRAYSGSSLRRYCPDRHYCPDCSPGKKHRMRKVWPLEELS